MNNPVFGPQKAGGFQVSVSSLTLGTLYEAILTFSSQDRFESFWPSVCQNSRWIMPSRRICILLRIDEQTFEIVGTFEKGKFAQPTDSRYTAVQDKLGRALTKRNPQWFTKPWEDIHEGADKLGEWICHDRPATLFVLPITLKGKNVGAILFVMGPIEEADQTMLTALGTVYALHVGMTYMLIQITEERRQQEKELQESEDKYSVLFHRSNDGILLLDLDGNIVDTNQKALELFGYTNAEMTSRRIFDLHPPTELEATQTAFKDLVEYGSIRFDVHGKKKDGGVFPVEISASLFEIEGKQVVHGLIRDITELKRTMEEVRERAQDLDEKNKELESALRQLRATQNQLIVQEKMASLGALTAGIAHEIKNPLNFVNNFAELSMDLIQELIEEIQGPNRAPAPEIAEVIEDILSDLQQNVTKINEHGNRANSIVNSMLLHSRGKSGERQPTDINALMDQETKLTYHGMRAKDTTFNITIETDYDDSIGPIEVVPQDISRAILNILDNGYYAAHKKKKKIGDGFTPTLWVKTKNLGNRVEIRVRDNGPGIPKDVVEKIFNPFFTTKSAGEGTGLGLSISYDILVQEHNGEIQVETEAGNYTEFIVTLPKTHGSAGERIRENASR